MVIWKCILRTTDFQQVDLPMGAQILTVQMQHDKPCLWALVNPDAPNESVTIETVGTGNQMLEADNRTYIGTYQMFNGDLIWHCFKVG